MPPWHGGHGSSTLPHLTKQILLTSKGNLVRTRVRLPPTPQSLACHHIGVAWFWLRRSTMERDVCDRNKRRKLWICNGCLITGTLANVSGTRKRSHTSMLGSNSWLVHQTLNLETRVRVPYRVPHARNADLDSTVNRKPAKSWLFYFY